MTRDTRSSESDSGASSADPEDELRTNSALGYLKSPGDYEFLSGNSSKSAKAASSASDSECFARKKIASTLNNIPPPSPCSLPPMSPGGVVPSWLPPFPNLNDPCAWRELWLRGPLNVAAQAPDQEQPIDLSVKRKQSIQEFQESKATLNREEAKVEEPVKSGVPLDLSLDR